MRPLAVIGHVARDVVDGGEPRIGGAPWYAGRALRLLDARASIAAKCGERERRAFLARLAALGLPVTLAVGGETTQFEISYDGEGRRMGVGAVGEPWSPEEAVAAVDRARWVHVGPLLRSDFPPETLRALGRERRLLLDGQGLVRVPQLGPLRLDGDFDAALLDCISILKVAEEEASMLPPLDELPVPEIILTLGTRGCVIRTQGREERVPARQLAGVRDPTGAGDGFGAAYLAARSVGHAPASAARHASALVAGLLTGKAR
jgi:sugar/nucleoside kinase (ribokinase family)